MGVEDQIKSDDEADAPAQPSPRELEVVTPIVRGYTEAAETLGISTSTFHFHVERAATSWVRTTGHTLPPSPSSKAWSRHDYL